jgi:hypothetical protein
LGGSEAVKLAILAALGVFALTLAASFQSDPPAKAQDQKLPADHQHARQDKHKIN